MAQNSKRSPGPGKPFEKGKSGNPGGRPKVVGEIRDLARTHAPDAFRRIVALIGSDDERVALAASQEILNRAYGKPAQAVTGEGGEGPVSVVLEVKFIDPKP